MSRYAGHAGLAMSTSAVALTGAIAQYVLLERRLGTIGGAPLLSTLSKVAIGSLAMAATIWLLSNAIGHQFLTGKLNYWSNILFTIPCAAAAYYFTCRWLGVAEMETAAKALTGPLTRLRAKIR